MSPRTKHSKKTLWRWKIDAQPLSNGYLRQIGASFSWWKDENATPVRAAVFKCSACRKYVIAILTMVRNGKQFSCGCREGLKTYVDRPWLAVRGTEEKVRGKYCQQVGPRFRTGKAYRTRTMAVFLCRCGQYFIAVTDKVRRGSICSCGCFRQCKPGKRHPVLSDSRKIIETRYVKQCGRAFRVGPVGSDTYAVFECRACSSRFIAATRHVRSGATKSCGCSSGRRAPKLSLYVQYLEALADCGARVEHPCLSAPGIRQSCEILFHEVGQVRAGMILGTVDDSRGWVSGNLQWITQEEFLKRHQLTLTVQAHEEVSLLRRRVGLLGCGTVFELLDLVVSRCGDPPTEFHRLQKQNPEAGRTPENLAWIATDPDAVFRLITIRRQVLERGSVKRKLRARKQLLSPGGQ